MLVNMIDKPTGHVLGFRLVTCAAPAADLVIGWSCRLCATPLLSITPVFTSGDRMQMQTGWGRPPAAQYAVHIVVIMLCAHALGMLHPIMGSWHELPECVTG